MNRQIINLDAHLADFEKTLERLKKELSSLRTGRANAAILDSVVIEAYGSRVSLKSMASISVPDAKTIVVEPWDKNILKDIEKGIIEARLGVNPVNDGQALRLPMPPMTEENRKNLSKILNSKLEASRIELRLLRDSLRDKMFAAEKEKLMGEDELYRNQKRLDEITKEYAEKIKNMGEEKEKEIMTV